MSEHPGLGPDDVAAVLDFTDAELATLRRFDAAPLLPEQSAWDSSPLLPSGPLQYAEELVPEPHRTSGTSQQWAQHYLADALAQQMLGRHLLRRNDPRDAPVIDVQEMAEAYHEGARSFLVAFLLRHVDDAVIREAMDILDGGEQGEWAWQWLRESGVDPYRLKTPRTRAERVAWGEARRAAMRRGDDPDTVDG